MMTQQVQRQKGIETINLEFISAKLWFIAIDNNNAFLRFFLLMARML